MNNVSLIGRITKEIELRYTPNGIAVANFTIAVDKRFKKDGEREANFIPVVVWNKTAEFVKKYFDKGVRIGVTGEIQTRSYDGKDGQKRYVTEVLANGVYFADGKGNSSVSEDVTSEEEFDLDGEDLPI